MWLIALLCVGVSSMMGSVNYITTIINMRAAGMTLYRMPMTIWAMFITAILQAFALPVLTVALILQLLDKTISTTFFLPDGLMLGNYTVGPGGGQPLLWQHLFWFYSHPAVYIMILPAMGMVSDIVSTFSRRPLFGYRAMIYSIAGIAGLGFIVWGHHMFQSGMDPRLGTGFMVATIMIALPSAVKVFNWLGTTFRGNLQLTTPMLFALSFVVAVHHRRAVGHLHGRHAGGHLHPRHVLHRRPYSLRAFRQQPDGHLRGDLLLVPQDVRPDDERTARQGALLLDVHLSATARSSRCTWSA